MFSHRMLAPELPIFRGFDDEFFAPHSRHCEVHREDIEAVEGLDIIADSEDAGITMVSARNGREIFITCHFEYSPLTLDGEYKRDVAKGLDIEIPKNYYKNDDPSQYPVVRWRAAANLLYTN